MSKYGHCHRGGMSGIITSSEELRGFSMVMNRNWIDSIIPIPRMDANKQRELAETCDHTPNIVYWECGDTGSHGWCCGTCGEVVQWG